MHPEPTKPLDDADLIVRPSTGLVSLPDGGSSALSEIISRSLAHIQTAGALVAPVRRAGEDKEFEIAPGVKIVMCWIHPGHFLMGSPEDEVGFRYRETQHSVTLTQGFWLGKYQVTQEQWEAVMGSKYYGTSLAPVDRPIDDVSWDDISGPGGFLEKANRFKTDGGVFRLPTEAQWEYACRAGTVTALNNGKNVTNRMIGACPNLGEVAWYRENSGWMTHPVGQKKANAWCLHDMLGNVWEWCADWYGDYLDGPQMDPLGPDSGSRRVFRGGSCFLTAGSTRSAARGSSSPRLDPMLPFRETGFRLARTSVPEVLRQLNERNNK